MTPGGILIIAVLATCIVIAAGSLAWGYRLAGFEGVSRWIVAFGILLLFAHWRKWKWFSTSAVLLTLALAAFGIWFEFNPGWMFLGAVFGLFTWSMAEFRQKIKLLPPREDAKGMTRRHLIRIGVLAAGAVVVSLVLGAGR